MADDSSSSPISRYSLDSTRSLLTPLYASSSSVDQTGRSIDASLSGLSLAESDLDDKYLQKNINKDNLMSTPISTRNQNPSHGDSTSQSNKTLNSPSSQDFSPWEQWVIKKAIAEQHAKIRKKQAKKQLLKEQELQNEKKIATSILCEEIRNEWLIKKKEQETRKAKETEEKALVLKMQEKQRREYLEDKAEKSYKEWLNKKEEQKLKEENQLRLSKQLKYNLIKEKNSKNEAAYKEWLQKAKTRPKRIPSSFAYSGGKLKGYYDATSSPSPAFTNPVSWNNEKVNSKTLKKEDTIRYESPPLLWKDVKARQHKKNGKLSKSIDNAVQTDLCKEYFARPVIQHTK